MPDNNDSVKLLLEEIEKLKERVDAADKKQADTEKRLDDMIAFNRTLLNQKKPETQDSHTDSKTKKASEKLEKYLEEK